jgi:hypothetical protein
MHNGSTGPNVPEMKISKHAKNMTDLACFARLVDEMSGEVETRCLAPI